MGEQHDRSPFLMATAVVFCYCTPLTSSTTGELMKCYVTGRVCTCLLDEVAENGCNHDQAPDLLDPFRQGERADDEHLHYLNGGMREAQGVY